MFARQITFNTGERLFPDIARAGSAELLDGFQPGLVSALMHYTDAEREDRVTRQGFAPVHFAVAKNGFSLVGFGEQGKVIIDDVAGPLAKAWSKRLARPVTIDARSIQCGIEWRPYGMRYSIPRLVIQKKARHLKVIGSEETGRPFIERLITRSIITQAEHLGLKVPSNMEVRFIGSTGGFGAKLGHGGAVLAGIRNAEFEVNACLKGLWSFGYIQSKGYGLLNADSARGGVYAVSE